MTKPPLAETAAAALRRMLDVAACWASRWGMEFRHRSAVLCSAGIAVGRANALFLSAASGQRRQLPVVKVYTYSCVPVAVSEGRMRQCFTCNAPCRSHADVGGCGFCRPHQRLYHCCRTGVARAFLLSSQIPSAVRVAMCTCRCWPPARPGAVGPRHPWVTF